MRRIVPLALMVILALSATPRAQAATDVAIADLLADSPSLAGQTISVVGELIGDYGFRNDGSAWSQLNGDSYATAPRLEGGRLSGSNTGIGIRAPEALIRDLDQPGDYHHRGPLVRATGIWKHHDEDRGGETYLDVLTIEVLEPGRELNEPANPAVVAAGSFFLLAALWLGYRSRQHPPG